MSYNFSLIHILKYAQYNEKKLNITFPKAISNSKRFIPDSALIPALVKTTIFFIYF